MRLCEWIKRVGDEHAAQTFGVKVRTAASWRRGERVPRPQQAAAIVKATRGVVRLDEIYYDREMDAA